MNPRQRQGIEDCEDRGFYLLRRIAMASGGNIGRATTEKIGTINPPALGNRRHPAVPECRIAGETVHHQHRGRYLPRPQVIVDGAVDGKTFGEANSRHQPAPFGCTAAKDTAISARPALATLLAGPSGPRDWPMA